MKMKMKTNNVKRNAEAVAKNVKRSIKTKQTDQTAGDEATGMRATLRGSVGEFKAKLLGYDEGRNEIVLRFNDIDDLKVDGLDSSPVGKAVILTLSEGYNEVGKIVDIDGDRGDRVTVKLLPREDGDQVKEMLSKRVEKQKRYQGSEGERAYATLKVFSSMVKGNPESITVTKRDVPLMDLELVELSLLSEEAEQIRAELGAGYEVQIQERVPDIKILMTAVMTGVAIKCIEGADGSVEIRIREAPRFSTYVKNVARNLKRSVRDATNIDLGKTTTISPTFVSIKDDTPRHRKFDILARELEDNSVQLYTRGRGSRSSKQLQRSIRDENGWLGKVRFLDQISVISEDGVEFLGLIERDSIKYDREKSEIILTMERGGKPGEPMKIVPEIRNSTNGRASIIKLELV
jgi:hypothetical protein